MKPADTLYKLIKSLTKGEKIYFKKFSKRHVLGSGNKYVKLFEIIDKSKNGYDENYVKKCFGNDKFINQIHVGKNYLFDLILQALYEYHADKDSETIINQNLSKIRLLSEKNLNNAARKLLNKTKDTSKVNFHYELLYKLLETEEYITAHEYSKNSMELLERLNKEKHEALENLRNVSLYKTLNNKLNIITSKWSYSNDPDFQEKILKILEIPEVENESKAADYLSKLELFRIKIKAYRFLLNDEKSLYYREKAVQLMEQYPEVIKNYPEKYISRLYDFINYALGTETGISKNFKIESYLVKMKKCLDMVLNSRMSPAIKALNWYYYFQMLIGYQYTVLNRDGFHTAILNFEREIELHTNYLRPRYLLNLYYYCIISFFEFKEYNNALVWQQKFINHKSAQQFEELFLTMLIVSVILHYELENFELAESLIKKTSRYYKKKGFKNESGKILISNLRMLNSAAKEDVNVIFKNLNEKLEILADKETEKRFLNSFNFRKWVSEKLKK